MFLNEPPGISFEEIVGHSKVKSLLSSIFISKESKEKTVLLVGESGVGKTMLMHALSMQTDD